MPPFLNHRRQGMEQSEKRTAIIVALGLLVACAATRWLLTGPEVDMKDFPDAYYMNLTSHRSYILDQGPAFVQRYMKGAPKQDAYRAAMSMQNHAGEIFGGDEFSARHGGFTRCTLTQYALTRYFCGKDLADAGMFAVDKGTVRQLISTVSKLQANYSSSDEPFPQYIFRCHIAQKSDQFVGHTWVIHLQSDGQYQIYQSFIQQYTLHSYLQKYGAFNYSRMLAFLGNIKRITEATDWGTDMDALYKENFLVSLMSGTTKLGSFTKPGSGVFKLFSGKGVHESADSNVDRVVFSYSSVCDADLPPSKDDTAPLREEMKNYHMHHGASTVTFV